VLLKMHYLLGNTLFGDLAELVSSFFSGDSVYSESTFDVIDKFEGFVGLLRYKNNEIFVIFSGDIFLLFSIWVQFARSKDASDSQRSHWSIQPTLISSSQFLERQNTTLLLAKSGRYESSWNLNHIAENWTSKFWVRTPLWTTLKRKSKHFSESADSGFWKLEDWEKQVSELLYGGEWISRLQNQNQAQVNQN